MSLSNFLVKIALKKAIQRGTIAAAASITALPLADYGITVQQDVFAGALIGVVMGLLEFVRNWLKQSFGLKFL